MLVVPATKGQSSADPSLASQEDVADVATMFSQFLNDNVADTDGFEISQRHDNNQTGGFLGSIDLGVQKFSTFDDNALNQILNYSDGNPLLFNSTMIPNGLRTLWEPPLPHPESLVPLKLLWHQKVGIATMVDHFWSARVEEPGLKTGLILADEVGLGKTAQLLGLLAFLVEHRAGQSISSKIRSPSIIGKLNLPKLVYSSINMII